MANTRLPIFYNSDDRAEEQGWTYVPQLRRMRRVAPTMRSAEPRQRVPTLGSSSVIDILNKHCTTLQMPSELNVERMKQKDIEPSAPKVGAR